MGIYDFIVKHSDTVGIIGVILVLLAYFLLNTNRVYALNLSYQLLNFVGASLILFSLLFAWNIASVIVEAAWIVISMIGIYRAYRVRLYRK